MARTAEGWRLWRDKKTGIYHVRFRHAGRRQSPSLGTRDSGEASRRAPDVYAQEVSRARPGPGVAPPRRAALDVLAALWLYDYRAGRPGRTADSYEGIVRARLRRFFHNRLDLMTSAGLADYARARLKEVKRATVARELSCISVFRAWLIERGVLDERTAPSLPRLPRGALGSPGAKHTRRKPRSDIAAAEVRALLDALPDRGRTSGTGVWWRPYFEALYETGLRPSTVRALSVPEHWAPGRAHLDLVDEHDKARMGRRVPLTPGARRALELAASALPPGGGRLFPRWPSRKTLEGACRAAGLAPIKPYDLRHLRATHLLEAGASLGAVAYLLGHRRVSTTAVYARPSLRAAEAALEALAGGKREVQAAAKRPNGQKKPRGGK